MDVVVDAKPMAQLPIDESTIPEAVRKRAAAVRAMYDQSGTLIASEQADQPSSPPVSELVPELPVLPAVPVPVPQKPVDTSPAPAVTPPAPPPIEDDSAESWKHRFLAMQGRYNASQKQIGEMQEQMTQLGNELLQVQQAVFRNGHGQQTVQPQSPPVYLTPADEQNYGRDLIDFTQRAAAQAIAPHLMQVQEENAQLRERLAKEARRNLDQRLELAVPNYREIDHDPRWHRWLLSLDMLSGRVRQQLLNEAISAADAPRVISFFKGFLQEEQATGHIEPSPAVQQVPPPRTPAVDLGSLAAPGRARPATGGNAAVPPEKPLYTRAQIRDLYAAHRKGAYVGREAEWDRQDLDIIAAGREGRIR